MKPTTKVSAVAVVVVCERIHRSYETGSLMKMAKKHNNSNMTGNGTCVVPCCSATPLREVIVGLNK